MPEYCNINRIVFTDGKRGQLAECTITYTKNHEPCSLPITIDDFHCGHALFWLKTEIEQFTISQGVTILALNADHKQQADEWFKRNSPVPVTLPT